MSYVIAVTGPAAAGKSTVSRELAERIGTCANIEVDHVKHFLECAFKFDMNEKGNKVWRYEEWALMGDVIGLSAKKYQEGGYDVIINGYLGPLSYREIQKHLEITHRFILTPTIEVTISRDKKRPPEIALGEDGIKQHYLDFQDSFFQNFIKIDTSKQAIDETVDELLRQLVS